MKKEKKFSFLLGVWIFTLGCFAGFILETIFYMIKYGSYVKKQGLLFGPFKPIYGFGALLFTAIYHLLKKKTKIRFFVVGVLIGSIFEYVSSWIIETIYHSYVWDYSNFKFNINGRIYLPYCIVWGLISLLWSLVYPKILETYHKYIEKREFKIISIILAVFMILNCLVTWTVLFKETCVSDKSKFYKVVDKVFPSKVVSKKFPKFRPLN